MQEKNQNVKYFLKRLAQLDNVYSVFKPLWQELADYYSIRGCKFLISDTNKKPKFSKKILDSTTGIAVRNFASGMMSGATNPAQKWFKTGIKNYSLSQDKQVKDWCANLTELLRRIFNSSNLYTNLPTCYSQMGIFGISVLSIEKDFENIIFTKVLPVGSYRIAKDYRGVVDTLYRVYSDTVGNIVDRFGIENVSDSVKTHYENKRFEESVEIIHAVEPNAKYDNKSKFSDKKKFISVYFEKNSRDDKFLEKKGFNVFPYVVFEANVNGEDVYPSDCPGITSLPDVKQLMDEIKDYNKTKKKVGSPQIQGSPEFKNKKMTDNPAVFYPVKAAGDGIRPVYEVNPSVLPIMLQSINDLRKIISQIWYNDLFVMLNNSDFTQPRTATELNYRKEEAMAQLAPLLQQVYTGSNQIIEITVEYAIDAEIVESPPEQIQDMEINIEFVSTMAQAQKVNTIGAMERTVTFAVNLANQTGDRTPIKKLNLPEIVDDYADYANVETDEIIPTDIVQAQLAEEAKQQQMQKELAALQQGSEIVKNMGGADASGGNLLERIGIQ